MIKGLRYKLTSGELRLHFKGRADYHSKRADAKEAEVPSLRDQIPQLKETLEKVTKFQPSPELTHMNKSMASYHLDPESAVDSLEKALEQLERDVRDHRNKATAFSFLADHLFEEDYDLEQSDLVSLEILKR